MRDVSLTQQKRNEANTRERQKLTPIDGYIFHLVKEMKTPPLPPLIKLVQLETEVGGII